MGNNEMPRIFLFLLCTALSAFSQLAKRPPQPQNTAQEPYGGYMSVAKKADAQWRTAHDEYKKESDSDRLCDGPLRQYLTTAQTELTARIAAWIAFYEHRASDAEESRSAAATVEAQNDGQLRSEQDNITTMRKLIEALEKRLVTLEASPEVLDGESMAKAKASLAEQINIRRESLRFSEQTVIALTDSRKHIKEIQVETSDEKARAKSYQDSVEQQGRMYSAFYAAKELWLTLHCRPKAKMPSPNDGLPKP